MPLQATTSIEHARALAQSGNYAEAEALCRHLIEASTERAEALNLLGVMRNIQGKPAEAAPFFRQAIAERPAIAKYHSNLGNALWAQNLVVEAELCYRKALTLAPGFEDARANLAQLLHLVDDREAAAQEYRILIRNHPGKVAYYAVLASLLESTNHLAEAIEVARAGLALAPDDAALNLGMAVCERSTGQPEAALQRLQGINPASLSGRYQASYFYERGLLHDRANQIDAAFADFAESNRLQAEAIRTSRVNKDAYKARLDGYANIDISWLRERLDRPGDPLAPIFLVGFPRSGTTLLDQILDSHPRIQTMEEKPAFARLYDDLDALIAYDPARLKDVSPAQIADLRQAYFRYVADFLELAPGNLLVDKLPLNISYIPYILTVFPDARFILALRHPCDCVLSCYMHLFGPNDAMANFYTLEDTADIYARVMGLWRSWAARLPLRYHTIHYENVVQDLPGEVKPLLDFLGLDWQEHMARPHEHAARREFINTPSRSQVIQPLYQRAAGRWRRYQPFMETVLPVLQPYIEYFGYAPRG